MAENILEYTLQLKDQITGTLTKIGISNEQQLGTWAAVEKKVDAASNTMKNCGVSIGSLRQKIDALQAEKEWIPADNVNAIRRVNIETKNLEKQIQKLESLNGGKLKAWFNNLKQSIPILGAVTNPLLMLGTAMYKIGSYVKSSVGSWEEEIEAERKLAIVMGNTMNATQGEIDKIVNLTSAQQQLGVVGDEVQKAGAQELATYLNKATSLEGLIPVMNDMLVQQYGLNASQEQAVGIATMMGKVMDGQVGALSRYGYSFTEAQEKVLKYGNEAQRAAVLADVVSAAVGGMNEKMAQTPEGKLKQYANNMGDLQERVGKLYNEIKVRLFPVFELLAQKLQSVISWFEQHQSQIEAFVGGIANVISVTFGIVYKVVNDVVGSIAWIITKIKEGNPLVIIATAVIGGLLIAVNATVIALRLWYFWEGLVSKATKIWTAIQVVFNATLWASPITWIVLAVAALVAIIVIVAKKTEGWGTLWSAVVDFMKYSFLAYVESVKFYFNTLVNGIMIGIDKIRLAWYKFKEAVGMGDSNENQAMIAQISKDVEDRKKAITDGAKQIADYANKAKNSFNQVNITSKKSDTEPSLMEKVVPATTNNALISSVNGGNKGNIDLSGDKNTGGASSGASSSVTGGTKSTNIYMNVGKVADIKFEGGFDPNSQSFVDKVANAVLQALNIAQNSVSNG
ncbi:MAG: hypothetical protein LBO06_02445 [Bacteroidales bacterium]|jgi:hypothetical protein|nr:hypothetical protein [Bacteroidales bacterium]